MIEVDGGVVEIDVSWEDLYCDNCSTRIKSAYAEEMRKARLFVEANEKRKSGPLWDTWPSSLPQVTYITADSGNLCVTCANENAEMTPTSKNVEDRLESQWRIIGAQLNRANTQCDNCYRWIRNH